MPRGTGSPGSVTSTAAACSSASSSRVSKRSRSSVCSRSSSPRTRFSSWPRAPRNSAGKRAELAQRKRQRARAPQRLDACVLQLVGRGGPFELLAPLLLQGGRVLH